MSISLYDDTLPTDAEKIQAVARLKTAFPTQTEEWFVLLIERLTANGFTSQRLKDAIANVIDRHQYKTITIADVINYDKRKRLYSYLQVCDLASSGKASFDEFVCLRKGVFARKEADIL